MDRRLFIAGTLTLVGCGAGSGGRVDLVCDPDLEAPLRLALAARGEAGGSAVITPAGPQELLGRAAAAEADLVVTREVRIADRLQRLGHARLEHRWRIDIDGPPIIVLAIREGRGHGRAVRLGKWLSGPEAAAAFGR